MVREPHHFTIGDFFKAILGSFIVGLTFLFKGSLVNYAIKMKAINVTSIIIITIIIVSIEIYALSYKFVKRREERPFYEFWAKRFFAIVISSFIAAYLSIYLYGLNNFLTQIEILKVTSAIFMPAAIAGAAIEVLKSSD
ncbi:MAG: hypothetical protein N3D84_02265 [Candidatus Woesearchaeota archaeon]|nr:hypothetical protein [Candidatus Woesearchaeota archaeon]